MSNLSIQDKVNYILDYLFDNFSFNKESFLLKFNIDADKTEEYFYQDKASLIYCDYFFFNLKFYKYEFYFERIDSKLLLENQNFFAIKALSNKQREKIFNFTESQRYNYLDAIILEQNNDFVSLITLFSDNSFTSFVNKGIDFEYIDPLFNLIVSKQNIDNF